MSFPQRDEEMPYDQAEIVIQHCNIDAIRGTRESVKI